ncbi:MAG: hypothetical protein ACI4W1_03005, partial [Ruminococcus sp.]
MYRKRTKITSLILALALVMSMCFVALVSASAAGETYYIAGDQALVGVQWDPAGVALDDNGDGTYSTTFTDVPSGSYAFKITDGTWANSWGKDGGSANYQITLNKTADVTVNFNGSTKEITVESEGLGDWKLEYISAVGNGDGAWLNGANWDPADETNKMTEVKPGIWEITYTDVPADNGYEVKFACNGAWQPYNWTITGELDGQTNTPQTVEVDGSTVTLRIDVNGFDFATGTGTVKPEFVVTPPTVETTAPETTEEPTTVPETTEEPTTAPETTVAPTEAPAKSFTVTATSNIGSAVTKTYSEADKTVTVTYYLKSAKRLLDSEWQVTYDPSILKVSEDVHKLVDEDGYVSTVNMMPAIEAQGTVVLNAFTSEVLAGGRINGNFSTVKPYKLSGAEVTDNPFVSVTFDIVGDYTKDTEVNLNLKNMTAGVMNSETGTMERTYYVTSSVLSEEFDANVQTATGLTEPADVPTEPETTAPETTEEPTTAPETTEEPTTVPETTEEPTTAPETTEPTTAPETTEPTTAPETTEPTTVGETKYYIAGDEGLVGVQWDPAGVELVKGEYTYDGAAYDYSVTFNDIAAGSYAFKITDGTWTNCWGKDGGNFPVNLVSDADVTVYFNSESKAIAVESEGLGAWELEYISAVGNGDGAWLYGANWDPADESNIMSEVEPGIWEITYTDIPADSGYEVKFACNGGWQPYNWTITGELDGQTNTPQTVEVDGSTVTLRIDVTGFDFATGVGTVKPEFIVTPPTTEPTTAPETTEEPTTAPETTEEPTTAPETTEPTTAAPAKSFTVTAKSNIDNAVSRTYSEADKTVTVTYYLKAKERVLDSEWLITYDPSILKVSESTHKLVEDDGYVTTVNMMPLMEAQGTVILNAFTPEVLKGGRIRGNFTGTTPRKFASGEVTDNPYITVTFDIVGDYTKDTDVTLDLMNATFAVTNPDTGKMEKHFYITSSVVHDEFFDIAETFTTLTEPAPIVVPTEPETTEPETTEPETTEPETTAPETTEPTTAPVKTFNVTATSNFANAVTKTYSEADKQLKVTYTLEAAKKIADGEWVFTYDPSILKFSSSTFDEEGNAHVMPYIDSIGGAVTNVTTEAEFGKAYGNFSNISTFYDFTKGEVVFEATFDIVGDYTKDTTVDLQLETLLAGEKSDAGYELIDYIVDGVPTDLFESEGKGTGYLDGGYVPPTEPETTEPTTAPETTEPETTEPATTEPATTEPATTEPATTEPATTEPATTE